MSVGTGSHRGGLRVLVLCADIGEGHLTVARELAGQLQARGEVGEVQLHTDMSVLGDRLGRFMTSSFELHLDRIGWTYELAYRVFYERPVPRRLGQLALTALSARALLRTIESFRADVVVAEYPVISAALGELRRAGRLHVPVCSSISDPAGLHYWAHPGIDLHLLQWPEATAEVDAIAGPGRAVPVRPLVDARFLTLASQTAPSDASLGDWGEGAPNSCGDGPLVVVSGGGWGIGDLRGATEAALDALAPGGRVVVLAGRSERTHADLSARFGTEPRVSVVGFTKQMPELLAAAAALVHTTGGTTALEARIIGCPLINYGTGVAHVRAHARALHTQGIAEWARRRDQLVPAIRRAIAAGRRPPLDVSALPEAADLIIGLAAS